MAPRDLNCSGDHQPTVANCTLLNSCTGFPRPVPCDFDVSISVYAGGTEDEVSPASASSNLGPDPTTACIARVDSDVLPTSSELALYNLFKDNVHKFLVIFSCGTLLLGKLVTRGCDAHRLFVDLV